MNPFDLQQKLLDVQYHFRTKLTYVQSMEMSFANYCQTVAALSDNQARVSSQIGVNPYMAPVSGYVTGAKELAFKRTLQAISGDWKNLCILDQGDPAPIEIKNFQGMPLSRMIENTYKDVENKKTEYSQRKAKLVYGLMEHGFLVKKK